MYGAVIDPYCYPGIKVLKNRAGLLNQKDLREFELAMTSQRFDEPLPSGRYGVAHFCAIHHHLFQDVYVWAGKIRNVRISKGGSSFCYPENIARELRRVFADLKSRRLLRDLSKEGFADGIAHFLAELNAVHAFRDGNGRAQMAFAAMLANRVGHPLDLTRLRPQRFLKAMVASFRGDERLLVLEIGKLAG